MSCNGILCAERKNAETCPVFTGALVMNARRGSRTCGQVLVSRGKSLETQNANHPTLFHKNTATVLQLAIMSKDDDNRSNNNSQFGRSMDYQRPRRPDPDTISYLRSLPLDIEASVSEISRFLDDAKNDNNSDEFPQSFAAAFSALDEVRNEIASLAGDEYGSESIELLAHITVPYSELAARKLLHACAGYYVHLATHRFGSHVVQTILQLSMQFGGKDCVDNDTARVQQLQDLAAHKYAPPSTDSTAALPPLADLILGVVNELEPHASQLAVHVCGSHVIRTLLCVLGGLDLVQPKGGSPIPATSAEVASSSIRRGKDKKKKKKKKKDSSNHKDPSRASSLVLTYQSRLRIPVVPDNPLFVDALETMTEALTGSQSEAPGELQNLVCHSSAGPLLILLLQVLTYSTPAAREWHEKEQQRKLRISKRMNNLDLVNHRLGVSVLEPKFALDSAAHQLARRILCWSEQKEEGEEAQPFVAKVIYELSGEHRGSHMLETLLRLSPDTFHDDIICHGNLMSRSVVEEYVEHDVSNYVVQTLIATARTRDQAESIIKVIEKVIASGLCIDLKKRRRGITWRAVEMAAKYRIGQDTLLKAIRLGFAVCSSRVDNGSLREGGESEMNDKKKKKRKRATDVELKDCISKLLAIEKPPQDGGKVGLDALGARTVYHMLRFAPRLCGDILKGILELSSEDLELLARDGLGSVCVMDGILDVIGPVTATNKSKNETSCFLDAARDLLVKLKPRLVALAVDRVGHHVVKKLFRVLPIDLKVEIVEEFERSISRLRGNAMGRSIMDTCSVQRYKDEGEEAWKHSMTKMTKKEEWLSEILGEGNDNDNDNEDGGGEVGHGNYDHCESTEEVLKATKKRKKKKYEKKEKKQFPGGVSYSMDDIMNAITIPKNAKILKSKSGVSN